MLLGVLSSLPLSTTGPLSPSVLYMRGVTGATLLKLLDFIYDGEVNVEHSLLKEFLQIGEDLRVEGLCEKQQSDETRNNVNRVSVKQESAEPVKIVQQQSVAPVSKQKEKIERKKERLEKKKRYSKQGNKSETTPAPVRNNKRKEPEKCEVEPTTVDIKSQVVVKPEPPPSSTSLTNSVVNNDEANKFDVYELGDSSEENEGLSLRDDARTPRKKAKKSLGDMNDEVINRDVLTMDPGEAHGILKLVENLDIIEENSEDLNVFLRLLNQLILKSDLASNVLLFCGLCQKSLKSRSHMLNHIESSHVSGVFHKCSDCGTKYKTRSNLSTHKHKIHKQPKKDDSKDDNNQSLEERADGVEQNNIATENTAPPVSVTNNISRSEPAPSPWEFDE